MTAGSPEWLAAFTAAIDTRDVEQLIPYFTPDASFTFGNNPPMQGHEGIRAGIGAFYSGIAGISHTVPHSLQPSPEVSVAEFVTTYTRLDGDPVTLPGLGVFELSDGLIHTYRVYADVTPVFAPAA